MSWLTLDELAYRVLPQVAPSRALADSEWRTLRAAAETLLESLPFEIAPEQVADNVERFLCTNRSKPAWRSRALLTLLEWLPLGMHGRSFSRLTAGERRELFESRIVGERGLWSVCAKIRYLVLMGAYGDDCVPAKPGASVPGDARPTRPGQRRRSLPLANSSDTAGRPQG